MGNFEKLVVLTVLFLSAVVLAVSLSGDGGGEVASPVAAAQERTDPGGGTDLVEPGTTDEEETAPELGAEPAKTALAATGEGARSGAADGGRAPSPFLDAAVDVPDAEAAATGTEPAEPAADDGLVVFDGLRHSAVDHEVRIYDVTAPITWEELARKVYGDATKVDLLRLYNEEMETPTVGAEVLVPIHDYGSGTGLRPRLEPRGLADAPKLADDGTRPAAAAGATGSSGPWLHYVVQKNDNLSKISKRFYGTAHRWKEIYEANQAVLNGPDWVRPGMELVIPGVGPGGALVH